MVGCAHEDDWLLDLLDGELSPERVAEVEDHLAVCSDCRRAVEDYRAIIDSYRDGPVEEPPAGETARILRTSAASTGRRMPGGRVALAAAAVLLLAGGVLGGWLLRGARPAEAPPVGTKPSRVDDEAAREAEEMRRVLAGMMREMERARVEQARAGEALDRAMAREGDAGIAAAKALQSAKAATGEAGEITGGAVKVDGPRGGSAGLAAPRWQAKKNLADDPLTGDLDL